MPLFSLLSREDDFKPTVSQTAVNIKNKRMKRFNRSNKLDSQEDQSNWVKTWNLLKQLTDILTQSTNLESASTYYPTSESDVDDDSDNDDGQPFITPDSTEKSSICGLFPSKNNVQMLEFNSVTPCSMNINLSGNPIHFETLPNGMITSTLNKNGFNPLNNGSSLPLSPQSNNSPNGAVLDMKANTPQYMVPTNAAPTTAATATTNNNNNKNDQGSFICHYCDATFKIRGYLTRHIKKHAIEKAYHCPFYDKNLPPELRCHNSGGFSRRDTYKTHLKARHFTFPNGVKANDRNKSDGACSHCGEHFRNSDDWITNHLETGKCSKLPDEYLIELKNKMKNKKKNINKLKMIKTSTGHSRFVSTVDSVIEQNVLKNKEALEAIAIVVGATNNNNTANSNAIPTNNSNDNISNTNNHTNSHLLSKYGDNQFILSSENFEGHKKPKRKYKPRKNKRNKNVITPVASANNSTPNTSSVDNTPRADSNGMSAQHMNHHPMTYDPNAINGMEGSIPSPSNLMLSNGINPQHMHNNMHVPVNNNYILNETPVLMNSNPSVSVTNKSSVDQSNKYIPPPTSNHLQKVANTVINSFTPITSQSSASSMSSTMSSNFLLPLDIEQQSMFQPYEEINNTIAANPNIAIDNNTAANPISNFDSQLIEAYQPDKINELQIKETKQYMNFYNFFFGSDL